MVRAIGLERGLVRELPTNRKEKSAICVPVLGQGVPAFERTKVKQRDSRTLLHPRSHPTSRELKGQELANPGPFAPIVSEGLLQKEAPPSSGNAMPTQKDAADVDLL